MNDLLYLFGVLLRSASRFSIYIGSSKITTSSGISGTLLGRIVEIYSTQGMDGYLSWSSGIVLGLYNLLASRRFSGGIEICNKVKALLTNIYIVTYPSVTLLLRTEEYVRSTNGYTTNLPTQEKCSRQLASHDKFTTLCIARDI